MDDISRTFFYFFSLFHLFIIIISLHFFIIIIKISLYNGIGWGPLGGYRGIATLNRVWVFQPLEEGVGIGCLLTQLLDTSQASYSLRQISLTQNFGGQKTSKKHFDSKKTIKLSSLFVPKNPFLKKNLCTKSRALGASNFILGNNPLFTIHYLLLQEGQVAPKKSDCS